MMALFLTGCSTVPQLSAEKSAIFTSGQIKVGAAHADVVAQLGVPERQEVVEATEFLFYRMPWQYEAYEEARNPIAFRDGKVVGFGNAYYSGIVKAKGAAHVQTAIAKKP